MESRCKFIHELPYVPRTELCRILDADKKWEELGGRYMKEDVTTLTLIGQAVHCGKSPTSELLNKYSERNGTIERLFIWLYQMYHHRSMHILKPYVDKKYQLFFKNEIRHSRSSFSFSTEVNTLRSSVSQLHITSTDGAASQILSRSTSHNHNLGICGTTDTREENTLTNNSKYEKADIKENCHSNSPRSNGTKVPHVMHKINFKRSPDLNHTPKNAPTQQKDHSRNLDKKEERSVPESNPGNGKLSRHRHSSSRTNSEIDTLPDIMHTTYSEICEATDNFNETRVLGKGGFGIVYKGDWKQTSVAIKRLTSRSPVPSAISLKQSMNELSVLKCCRYDYILPLYAVSLDGAHPCLVYKLMANGSLEDRLHCKDNTPPLTWPQRIHIAECTAKGLHYLHTSYAKSLVHGDIKSGNILLDSNMDAKIGDFGLTRLGPDFNNTYVYVTSVNGTRWYLPDEYLRSKKLCPKVDIYSYGIVMFEIATRLKPFDPNRKQDKILTDRVKYNAHKGTLDTLRDDKAGTKNMLWFEELIKIGQDCSNIEKKKRPPMKEVLERLHKIKSTGDDIRDKVIQNDDAYPRKRSNSFSEIVRFVETSPPTPLVTSEIENMSQISKSVSVKKPSSPELFESCAKKRRGEMEPGTSEVQTNQERLSPKKEQEPETRVPPIPFISTLLAARDFAGNTAEGVV